MAEQILTDKSQVSPPLILCLATLIVNIFPALEDSAQIHLRCFHPPPSSSAGIYQRRLLIYTAFPARRISMQVVSICVCVRVCIHPPPHPHPHQLCQGNQSVCVAVPPHLSTLIRRWGDNWEGMIVKEIMGDSITPLQELLGAGFLTRCPGKHLFAGTPDWRRQAKAAGRENLRLSIRGVEGWTGGGGSSPRGALSHPPLAI